MRWWLFSVRLFNKSGVIAGDNDDVFFLVCRWTSYARCAESQRQASTSVPSPARAARSVPTPTPSLWPDPICINNNAHLHMLFDEAIAGNYGAFIGALISCGNERRKLRFVSFRFVSFYYYYHYYYYNLGGRRRKIIRI